MVFEAHGMSFPCTELLLFNYAMVNTVFHSMAPLNGKTESLIFAAQDQALNTKYHQKNILKQTEDSKCRMCNKLKST